MCESIGGCCFAAATIERVRPSLRSSQLCLSLKMDMRHDIASVDEQQQQLQTCRVVN